MFERCAGGTFALDQQGSLAGWRAHGQLVEGENFTAAGQNATASLFGDTQSAHLNLGNFQDARVVRDAADNDGNGVLVGAASLQETADTLQ